MPKILVVNNDFDTMTLLQTWLERKNYNVKYTGVVDEVPHIVRKFKPDVVIIDVMQHEVAEQLKKDKETSNVRIILMTGYATTKRMLNGIKVDDIIEKPFNLPLLEKKIEALID